VSKWVRFLDVNGAVHFGTVKDDLVVVHSGDMFNNPVPLQETVQLDDVILLTPCDPTKMIALWNNSATAAAKGGWAPPADPLYFLKPPSSFTSHLSPIRRPRSYDGRILYEGELGVVIGSTCVDVKVEDADTVIFGYTCVNDVTALDMLHSDVAFPQWCRAKGFDTFGAFGPQIVSGIVPDALVIRTSVGGKVRQDYPVSDMFFSPYQLVSLISRDMTLQAGDVIACGTALGALPMRPGVRIDVSIEGVGTLSNALEDDSP
jgi:2-keto-4-pentenoate hydratase/2-oxohepta-3-ene-1,7-dioic acid hydratase in catechol pathway